MPSLSSRASELRRAVAALSDQAAADLAVVWEQVQTPREAREALLDVVPSLVDAYGAASSTLAADWYDDVRDELGIGGRFGAIPHDLGDTKTDGLVVQSLSPVFAAEPDWHRARVLVDGGMQSRIANAARYTVADSAVADPSAVGWQRIGDGSSCAFCLMLIGRGAVYRESRARFASHEFCGCSAVPAFGGEPLPVQKFTPSPRHISDADRARVRAWMAENL